jgi:hypothetical protein
MDSYKYHYTHVRLLSKTGVGGERISAFLNDPSSILTKRDYAESIEAKMNDEIQGDHYGEQGRIKLEGATAQYHINSAGHIDVDDVERIMVQFPKIIMPTSWMMLSSQLQHLTRIFMNKFSI